MSATLALIQFIAHRFPGWGVCEFHLEPRVQTLYVYCHSPRQRAVILRDAKAISHLDIGIKRFMFHHPTQPVLIIDSICHTPS